MGNRAKEHGRPTVDEHGKPGRFKATTQLMNESQGRQRMRAGTGETLDEATHTAARRNMQAAGVGRKKKGKR